MGRSDSRDAEERISQLLDTGDLAGAAAGTLQQYGPQILGYLVSVLREEDAAKEVFAQFCEDLWKGMSRFRRECSMQTWAFRLAWEATRRFLRDPFRKRGVKLDTGEWAQLACEVRERTLSFLRSTNRGRMARLRDRLGPSEQTLLILRVDRDLSWEEVAAVMQRRGQPADVATLRKRYERLKRKLRRLAQAEGLLRAEE